MAEDSGRRPEVTDTIILSARERAREEQSFFMQRFSQNVPVFALSDEEQTELDVYKRELRISNERYMRDHPEFRLMMKNFVKSVMKKRPEDIRHFAYEFFVAPDLEDKTTKELSEATKKTPR